MPYLKEIVDQINNSLANNKLNDVRFKSKYAGITQTITREEDEMPVIVDSSGQGTFKAFDDAFNLIIYHRCNDISYSKAEVSNTFGDDTDLFIETANMKAVVWANRNILHLTQEQLIFLVVSGIPASFPSTVLQFDGLHDKNIEVGTVNNNSQSVWAEEFKLKDVAYPIKPEHIYFSINYKIITNYSASCSDACAEC